MVYPGILKQVTKPSLFDRQADQAYMVYPEILKQVTKPSFFDRQADQAYRFILRY